MQAVKRPTLITVVSIIAFAAAVLSFPSVFSPFVKKKGDFFPAITGLVIAFEFISVVGIWYMKKWGLRTYIMTAMANQALLLAIDNWSVVNLILPVLVISATAFYFKSMDENL